MGLPVVGLAGLLGRVMTKTQKPVMHGRDHLKDGPDPIAFDVPWIAAELTDDWTGQAYYRRSYDGVIELAGSVTGTTNTVAFTLPGDFVPDADVSYLAAVSEGDGVFNAALVEVSAETGTVTITYPMT